MLLSWVSANRSLYAADTTKNRCVTFPVWFLPVLILTTLWFRRSCDYVPLNTANILSSTTLRVVFSTVRRLITSAGFLMFTILYHIEHPFLKKTTLIKRLNNVWHGIIINRLSLCWIIMGGPIPKCHDTYAGRSKSLFSPEWISARIVFIKKSVIPDRFRKRAKGHGFVETNAYFKVRSKTKSGWQ